jgi:hypothetical protein
MELGLRRRVGVLLTSAALLASLTVGSLASPVAAANPVVTLVNGIPGVRVDICIGGKETKSRLPYGAKVQRSLLPGTKTVKVYKADPRKCKGKVLAKRSLTVAADADLTLVATRFAPKFVTFDNTATPGASPQSANVFLRHAADLGPATMGFFYQIGLPLAPAAYPTFSKGGQTLIEIAGISIRSCAQRAGNAFASSRWVDLPFTNNVTDTFGNRHIEFILVGTNVKNAKFAVIDRPPLT